MGTLGTSVDSVVRPRGHSTGDTGDTRLRDVGNMVLGTLRTLCWGQGERRLEVLGTLCWATGATFPAVWGPSMDSIFIIHEGPWLVIMGTLQWRYWGHGPRTVGTLCR